MQEHPSGRNFIYSLWDPISSNEAITAEYVHPATQIANFGGEGTGLRSLNFGISWETNQWYSLVSRAWSVDTASTLFAYWVYDQHKSTWHHVVTMNYPVPNLKFNTKTSSFIEDWLGNGPQARTVHHKNGWKRKTLDSSWIAFDKTYFDRVYPDAGTVNYIENYDGGVINDSYYFMTSGGTTTPISNEDDVMLYLTNNASSPGFETGKSANLLLGVDKDSLFISWDIIESKAPQFSYHIRVYDTSTLTGTPLISIDSIKPHLRNDTVDIRALPDNKEYFVEFYIVDIFDGRSEKQVKSFVKGKNLSTPSLSERFVFSVYPNPLANEINIDLKQQEEEVVVQLFSMDGKPIFQKVYQDTNAIKLALNLAKGVYFIKVKTHSKHQTFRIVKN